MGKALSVLGLALGLSACANLSAVSDFTKLSSDVTANTAAIDSYPEAAQEIARMAPPSRKAERDQEAQAAKGVTEVADLGLKSLSLYFSTLSKLADDKTVDVKSSATSIGASLKTLGAVKASMADPATALITLLLTIPLDAYRRSAIAKLIEGANEPVQQLAEGLATFAGGVASEYQSVSLEANTFYANLHNQTSDRAAQEMLEEWRRAHVGRYSQLRSQALAAETAFRNIKKGQAALYEHKSDLSGPEIKALLAKYADEIFKASSLLPLH
jgi:hypothetical protein